MGSAALVCLAMNIYFEARGESLLGQELVAETTINRMHDRRWPNTICDVVHEPYQFSWTAQPYDIKDWKAFSTAILIANRVLNNKQHNLCIDHYHNFTVTPVWSKGMKIDRIEGNHIFYCSNG